MVGARERRSECQAHNPFIPPRARANRAAQKASLQSALLSRERQRGVGVASETMLQPELVDRTTIVDVEKTTIVVVPVGNVG